MMWTYQIIFYLFFFILEFLPARVLALDQIEIYLAGYGMVPKPLNQGILLTGKNVSDAKIDGSTGLGIKIGLFPAKFNGYLGMELESFGQNNSLSFLLADSGNSISKARSNLVTYGSMINVLLRYPGNLLRPYVGVGGGISNGILHRTQIPDRKDRDLEMATSLGYQLFGGMQVVFTKRWFVFGEYKYHSANFHWKQISLNYRSEYILGGIGFLF